MLLSGTYNMYLHFLFVAFCLIFIQHMPSAAENKYQDIRILITSINCCLMYFICTPKSLAFNPRIKIPCKDLCTMLLNRLCKQYFEEIVVKYVECLLKWFTIFFHVTTRLSLQKDVVSLLNMNVVHKCSKKMENLNV